MNKIENMGWKTIFKNQYDSEMGHTILTERQSLDLLKSEDYYNMDYTLGDSDGVVELEYGKPQRFIVSDPLNRGSKPDNTTIQVSRKCHHKLELLKQSEGDTFEDVIKRLMPSGVTEYDVASIVEAPAFKVWVEDVDISSTRWEKSISWSQLREDPVGTLYFTECKNNYPEDAEFTGTIVFKDDSGVVVLFKTTEYHEHHSWRNTPHYKVEKSIEWLERFTFL